MPSGSSQRVVSAGRLDLDFAEQNFVRVIADLDDIRNPRVLDRLILETEPTPFGDVLRQRFVFDELGGRRCQRLRQAIANNHDHKLRRCERA
jgi:hypothetical protein